MSYTNGPEDDLRSIIKTMEQKLDAERIAKEKILTRLKGYETVAKLATEKQHEVNELRQKLEKAEREVFTLRGNKHEEQRPSQISLEAAIVHQETEGTTCKEQTNDAVTSTQGLTDLRSCSSTPNSVRGSSSSFVVIGKSSRDVNLNYSSIPHFQSLSNRTNGKPPQDEFQELSYPQKPDESKDGDEMDLLGNSLIVAKPEPSSDIIHLHSAHDYSKEKQKTSQPNTLDEYIQVFPENSQSGGSNFYSPSLDSRVSGGQSCINSSRRGPMSMIAVGQGSLSSYQYVDLKKEEEKKNSLLRESNKSTAHDAIPLSVAPSTAGPTHTDPFIGTGARPKGLAGQQRKSVGGDEENGSTDIKPPTSDTDETAACLLVKIPSENPNSYRINNAPMLSYGRQESHTELSALTSFGSSLSSPIPLLKLDQEQHGQQYNNLNMAGHAIEQMRQRKEKTEDFVIIEEAPPVLPSTNPIIPQVKPNTEEATLEKELESVRKKMTQLHMANKEWKDRWDALQKQKEDVNIQLHGQVKKLVQERDRMKRELEYLIASQKEELNQMNMSKKDTENAYTVLLNGRSQEKKLLEKLKQDYGTLHQEKRSLEIQLEGLQANKPVVQELRPAEVSKTSSELETELAVVKRQVTLFMDDFNKEHQERLSMEKALQKERESHQHLETKLRKAHTLLKSRDEDLRQKSKQAADLQYKVDDLKLKLEVEQRRSSIYPSMDVNSSGPGRANVEVSLELPSLSRETRKNIAVHTQNLNVHAPKPDRWSCVACTYENKMSHKKCEICATPCTGAGTEPRFVELN